MCMRFTTGYRFLQLQRWRFFLQKKKDEAIKNAIANELKIIESPLIEEKANEGQNKLDAMVLRFHKDYGLGGYSDHYTCPSN